MISRSHDLICEGIFVIWAYPSLVNSVCRISQINEESLFPIRKGLFSLTHRRFIIILMPYQRTIYYIIVENEKGSC